MWDLNTRDQIATEKGMVLIATDAWILAVQVPTVAVPKYKSQLEALYLQSQWGSSQTRELNRAQDPKW